MITEAFLKEERIPLSMKQLTILVAGGTGFVGRKVVELLRKDGHDVIIYHRSQRAVPTHADAIINCVGIIREDHERFKEAHVDLARWLVRLGKKLKVRQFVQVSALGVQYEATAYQRTKLQAEHIVQTSGLPYVIIRPSLIFGRDDRSINLFRKVCRTGFFPLFAKGTVQPVSVDTVAQMIVAASYSRLRDRIVEVGGPEVMTYAQLADRIHPGVRVFTLPRWIARSLAVIAVVFRALPTREQIVMLGQENSTKDRTVDRLRIANPKLL